MPPGTTSPSLPFSSQHHFGGGVGVPGPTTKDEESRAETGLAQGEGSMREGLTCVPGGGWKWTSVDNDWPLFPFLPCFY